MKKHVLIILAFSLLLFAGYRLDVLTMLNMKPGDRFPPGPTGEVRIYGGLWPPVWYGGASLALDGDTLVVDGQRVRLAGVDAPEADQICQDAAAADYPCGEEAARLLRNFIAGRPVSCRLRYPNGGEPDGYDDREGNWLIALCSSGENDLGNAMVRTGHAIAYTRSSSYFREQGSARAAGRGLWQGRFIAPENWREGSR